jgi:hypothetical protein
VKTALLASVLVVTGTAAQNGMTTDAGVSAVEARLFDRKVAAVVEEAPDDGTDEDETLLESRSLKKMYSDPERYLPVVEAYLRRHGKQHPIDDRRIKIAVLVLQCLPLNGYLSFLDRLADAGRSEIARGSLLYAVFPGGEWSTRLQTEYKRNDVRETLGRVAASPNADENLRKGIVSILLGRAAKGLSEIHEKPVLVCPSRPSSER